VLEVLADPFARQLRTEQGRRHLRLCGQLINHPRFIADPRDITWANTSVQRCARYLAPALTHLPPEVATERASQIAGFLVRACADQARLMDTSPPPRPVLGIEAFAANLVDTLLAIYQAPSSITAGQASPGT
jgi:Tetracyclin repressor-like, C-terminal domain